MVVLGDEGGWGFESSSGGGVRLPPSSSQLAPQLQILKTKVRKKGVVLMMMPTDMARHRLNHSFYNIKWVRAG